jgi:hypothetical protein
LRMVNSRCLKTSYFKYKQTHNEIFRHYPRVTMPNWVRTPFTNASEMLQLH